MPECASCASPYVFVSQTVFGTEVIHYAFAVETHLYRSCIHYGLNVNGYPLPTAFDAAFPHSTFSIATHRPLPTQCFVASSDLGSPRITRFICNSTQPSQGIYNASMDHELLQVCRAVVTGHNLFLPSVEHRMRMEILAYRLFKLDGFVGRLSNGVDCCINTGTFMQNVVTLHDRGCLFVDPGIISLYRNLVEFYNVLEAGDRSYLDHCLSKGLYRFTNSSITLTEAEAKKGFSFELFRYLRSMITN